MLGKSLVIVPKNIDNTNDNLELSELISELNKEGFTTKKTRVGHLF